MITDYRKLQRVIDAGLEVAQIRDMDALLERTLENARQLVNADAGSIYIKDEEDRNILNFCYTQNDTLQKRGIFEDTSSWKQYSVPVTSDSIAGYVACTGSSVNISDAYQLPENTPYSFNSEFDRQFEYRTESMLVLPLKNPSLFQRKKGQDNVNGVLQLINARNTNGEIVLFSEDDARLVMLFAHKAETAIHQAQVIRAMILGMVRVAELRDPKETGAHVRRVGAYSAEIYGAWARKKGHGQLEIDKFKDALRITAMLHDVGKVAIEDAILKKPGKLTDDEYNRMKEHSVLGARLLEVNNFSDYGLMATRIALTHHERWDGKGYPGSIDIASGQPKGGCLQGEEIPIEGRIVAVADVYDALTHRRAYKDPWPEERVMEEMKAGAGSQFDPEIIEAFLDCYEAIQTITNRFPDETGLMKNEE